MQICVMQLHFGDIDALSDVTRPHRLAAGLDMFAGDRNLFIRDRRFYVQYRIIVALRTTACYIPTNPSFSVATYLPTYLPTCLSVCLSVRLSCNFVFQLQKHDGVLDVILFEIHAMGVHFSLPRMLNSNVMDVWIVDVRATLAPLLRYRLYGYPN